MTARNIFDIRRANLTRLLAERGAKKALAEKLDATASHVSHMVSPPGSPSSKPIHEEKARQIEELLGLTPRALDTDTAESAPTFRAPAQCAMPIPAGVDEQLLEDSVRVVIAAAADTHSTLIADKAAQIVRMVYANARLIGHVDPTFVQQLVKLMR